MRRKHWPWAMAAGILGLLDLVLLLALPNKLGLQDTEYWSLLGLTIFATVVAVGVVVFQDHRMRQRARQCDFQLCLNCGQALTGLPGDGTCPECGEPYRHEDNQEAWVGISRKKQS
ncbi:MAG: hypothetical protein MK116_07835 [Phycisphaerales bacterium]|nr:hypothetical protein [Phycisphaerales bacterium]